MQRLKDLIKDLLSKGRRKRRPFKEIFKIFKEILAVNNQVLELIANANDKLSGDYVFDKHYIESACADISYLVQKLVFLLDDMAEGKYQALHDSFQRIESEIQEILAGRYSGMSTALVLDYSEITKEFEDAVGGKNAALAEIRNLLNVRVPEGFAITSSAFAAFMDHKGLGDRIKAITQKWRSGKMELEEASRSIMELIFAAPLPNELRHAIEAKASAICRRLGRETFFAVRSSAWGEDSELSFAGQYETVLGVPPEGVAEAYRRVVASAYSERAMEYRRSKGYEEHEVIMCVGCQQMIDAVASGILYTHNPVEPAKDVMLISSSWGLGAPVVSGEQTGDVFTVSRREPFQIVGLEIAWKKDALYLNEHGGTEVKQVASDIQMAPSLTTDQVRQLAETGLLLEKYFKKPQDIEFAVDSGGQVIILQSRELAIKTSSLPRTEDLSSLDERYEVILKGKGAVAQEGVAIGPVYKVTQGDDLAKVPAGSILVAHYASPRFAKIMARLSGIITDVGAITGHLATVAREYRVPALMNTSEATRLLQHGEFVTLDTEQRTVYRGEVKELYYYSLSQEPIEETYEYRLLRRVLKKIEPLNLVDPSDRNFRPERCLTYHDITRFVHEKSVETIIDLHFYQNHDPGTASGKLSWDQPLDLVIIDIGGGLKDGRGKGREILPEEVMSRPMQGLLKGMAHPGAWSNEPMSIDVSSFMSSLTRTFSAEIMNPKQVGQNLAVISEHYVNLSLRLGYHFTMVDSYVSENIIDNYIYFRFFGGVTELARRSRRALFLAEVLSYYDFRVEVHGDLVVGRLKKLDEHNMLRRLYLLGLLIGYTRQLDVRMVSDEHIKLFVKEIHKLMEEKYV